MFRFFKNPKFPTILFMSASILALLFLTFLFFGYNFVKYIVNADLQENNQYSFDENSFQQSDPLITKVPQFEDSLASPIVSDADPSLGSVNAEITIVQFSDFRCKFCQQQESILKQIYSEYKDKVRIVWKDFPEKDPKSVSFRAALAARCAQKQKHFWEYHDLLFEKSDALNDNMLSDLAKKISLNLPAFMKCIDDPSSSQPILDNMYEANSLDISGIPFIFVNDQELMGQTNYEEMKKMVELQLSNKNN
jgi:protein-disulfide isomerase